MYNTLTGTAKAPLSFITKPVGLVENGFYFSVVSRCLILHGFGEPFLDKYLIKRLESCKKRNIPTYFSCTPATMTVEKAVKAIEAGLTVLKFSLDAMDDEKIKSIRGFCDANFSSEYNGVANSIVHNEEDKRLKEWENKLKQYAVYEKKPAHGSLENNVILAPYKSKEEAAKSKKQVQQDDLPF